MTEEEKTETEKRIDEAKAFQKKLKKSLPSGWDKATCEAYDGLKEALENIESGVAEMQERGLEWYLEQYPDQALDVMIPETTTNDLRRSGIIDTNEAKVFSLRTLCEILDR